MPTPSSLALLREHEGDERETDADANADRDERSGDSRAGGIPERSGD